MDAMDVVKKLMEEKGVSYGDMAKALGLNKTTVWNRLNGEGKKSLRVDSLSEMLQVLNYKLIAEPASDKELEANYTITISDHYYE